VQGLHPEAGGRWPRLHIDHDHVTGRVRGLLCLHCNTSLGLFGEDPALMDRAADYLEQ
jgi:Recombination endonuclease VII